MGGSIYSICSCVEEITCASKMAKIYCVCRTFQNWMWLYDVWRSLVLIHKSQPNLTRSLSATSVYTSQWPITNICLYWCILHAICSNLLFYLSNWIPQDLGNHGGQASHDATNSMTKTLGLSFLVSATLRALLHLTKGRENLALIGEPWWLITGNQWYLTMTPPQTKKALLRDYWPPSSPNSLNKILLRPSFLRGVPLENSTWIHIGVQKLDEIDESYCWWKKSHSQPPGMYNMTL